MIRLQELVDAGDRRVQLLRLRHTAPASDQPAAQLPDRRWPSARTTAEPWPSAVIAAAKPSCRSELSAAAAQPHPAATVGPKRAAQPRMHGEWQLPKSSFVQAVTPPLNNSISPLQTPKTAAPCGRQLLPRSKRYPITRRPQTGKMVNLYKPRAKAAKSSHSAKHAAPAPAAATASHGGKAPAAWSRLGYSCQKQEVRDWLAARLASMRDAVVNASGDSKRPRVTKALQGLCAAGTNCAMKALERDSCRLVVVCRDAPDVLHNHVVEAAHMRGVPVVVLPKSSLVLSKPLGVKRISCIAFLVQPAEQATADSLEMQLSAIQDQICESMFSHAAAAAAAGAAASARQDS